VYELIIALVIIAAVVAVVQIPNFLLLRSSGTRLDQAITRGNTREKELVEQLDETAADRDAAREAEKILHDNQGHLLAELEEHKRSNTVLAQRLVLAKKAHDDLLVLLQNNPGAIPAAVRGAVERLREAMSAAGQAPPAPAGDRPRDREVGPVRSPDDLEPP